MKGRNVSELRGYLKKAKRDPIPEFDSFLENVDVFIKLRVAAEENFKSKPHLAYSKRHALPLDWSDIKRILNPDARTPEESLVTQIIRDCLAETEGIVKDLRKVLVRQREMVTLGKVQQIDSQCLRWISKQPGRDAIEKAGTKQRILAVVRRENYNTLENRVFKDFILRVQNPCAEYLKRNSIEFKDHVNVKKVKRLFSLCGEALLNPIMDSISDITEMPYPNYVLRQEQRYSKLWKGYCRLIRHAHMAELLLSRDVELETTLFKFSEEAPRHTYPLAKYHCPIWFNYIDGKNDLLDQPFYKNEICDFRIKPVERNLAPSKDVILDLTGNQPDRNLLIYSSHNNAKPFLQNFENPSIEYIDGENHFTLTEILRKKDHNRLRDYFEQLHAHIKGERWFVLVPDEWDAEWQEHVIKSVPLRRQKVVLVWRSVAAALGVTEKLQNLKNGNIIAVIDFQQSGIVGMSRLSLALGDDGKVLIPQRRSYSRHKQLYSSATISPYGEITKQVYYLNGEQQQYFISSSDIKKFNAFVNDATLVLYVNCVGLKIIPEHGIILDNRSLTKGVQHFITRRDKSKISYYDELEALSLIVQNSDERIIAKTLVKANEKSPGGKEIEMPLVKDVATLKMDSDYVDFILCMGEAKPTASLKILRQQFNISLSEDHTIDLSARITPGQGMAIVSVMSDFLRESIELDFVKGMKDMVSDSGQKLTMATLEGEMNRSFPPDSPDVVADYGLWRGVKAHVEAYINNQIPPDGTWFAKATWVYSANNPLPAGSSPLEKLRRKNIFGNDPNRQLPEWGYQQTLFDFNFDQLFQKLAEDYEKSTCENEKEKLIRLIAWTYQSKHPSFSKIRNNVIRHLLDYAEDRNPHPPLYQEMSLCANLSVTKGDWADCMKAVYYRISDYGNKVSRDFYLLYNLLQFHPTLIRDTEINRPDLCWKWVQHFPYWYNKHRNSSTTIGYILKSLLYFLRSRRFDGKIFLTKDRDSKRFEIISECLDMPVHQTKEFLRKTVIEYLNNRGTIDGLPVDNYDT